jgi:hypothetical protein
VLVVLGVLVSSADCCASPLLVDATFDVGHGDTICFPFTFFSSLFNLPFAFFLFFSLVCYHRANSRVGSQLVIHGVKTVSR